MHSDQKRIFEDTKQPIARTKTITQSIFATRSLVTMALFTAILCVSAYISIALPNGMHVTFLNFMITLIALIFPLGQSFTIVFVWMLLGSIGVPVFIGGNAGIGYLLSALGGYTFAFLFASVFIPLFRGKKYHRIRMTIVSIISAVLVDLIGSLWLAAMQKISIKQAILVGVLPFIVLDLIKVIIAAQIAPAFRKVIVDNETE